MPLPKQTGVYRDCYEIWEAAAHTPGGVRALIGTFTDAEYFRARMHQSRSLLRTQSRRTYDKTHPAYDTSEYDHFKIVLKEDDDGDWFIYVEQHGNWNAVANIEPIPVDERPTLPPTQRLLLAHEPTPPTKETINAEPSDLD